jgi:crotonobetainyl-CoA:carnitine CoA-transferase CaiB-like acyl-CoA transferase
MLENNVPCGKIKNLEEVFNDASAKELIRSEQIEGKETKRVTSLAFKWK